MMKIWFLPILAISLCAQTAAPKPQTPEPARTAPGTTATPNPAIAPGTAGTAAKAETAKPPEAPTPPDKVVAKIDGKDYTAGQIKKIVDDLPAQYHGAFEQNPTRLLSYIFMLKHLANQAEFHNLDKDPQFKENLEFTRMTMLSQAELTNYRNGYRPTQQEQQEYYNKNSKNFESAKVKVIYVAYVTAPPKNPAPNAPKVNSEAEAKAKIEGLRKQVTDGADFGKVAKESSEDKLSAPKNGDFSDIERTSSYPDAVKNAIFALKPQEVSEPIQQPNGFYLFQLQSINKPTFDQVSSKIYQELQQQHFNEWLNGVNSRFNVTIEDPKYFAAHPPR